MTGFSDDLDDLFAQAKTGTMEPSGDLMARVLADAARVQPQPQTARRSEPTRNLGVWAGLAALFGGGGALAGLGSAAVAGLFIGFVQPTSLTALADAWSGETQLDSVDLMPGIDALLTEE
jgi:hypothetical protein